MIVRQLKNAKNSTVLLLCLAAVMFGLWLVGNLTNAEISGSSPDSSTNSRIKTLSDDLISKSFGSTSSGGWGDWGVMWNRIYSSAIWTPSGSVVPGDVAASKTFYGNSRVRQTGQGSVQPTPSPVTPAVGDASRLNTLYKALKTISYGSESGSGTSWGDWGGMWNRIYSASVWTPSDANAIPGDVLIGKTFYSGNNRTLQIGTLVTGVDGSLTLSTSKNMNTESLGADTDGNGAYADGIAYKVTGISGSTITTSTNATGIVANDKVLLIDLQGTSSDYGSVGNYEILDVNSVSTTSIVLKSSPTKNYKGTGNSYVNQKVAVQRIPQYNNVTINSGGMITASGWEVLTTVPTGNAGFYTGIVAFNATGTVTINSGGSINTLAKGYRTFHSGWACGSGVGWGEGLGGYSAWLPGGGNRDCNSSSGGGGGGASFGTTGNPSGGIAAGSTYGEQTLAKIYLGSGGGDGSNWAGGSYGGSGGGIIILNVNVLTINSGGSIINNGEAGFVYTGNCNGGKGGGSGGSIFFNAKGVTISGTVSATGGAGGPSQCGRLSGGNGGSGRIAIYYTTLSGTTNPVAYTQIN